MKQVVQVVGGEGHFAQFWGHDWGVVGWRRRRIVRSRIGNNFLVVSMDIISIIL